MMFDFKTFGQMNLDMIFKGFDRMPAPGEEVFAESFAMQLGGGPMVCPIVLKNLGCRVQLGTFLGDDEISGICRNLLHARGFSDYKVFASLMPDPVVVTSVFSWPNDRGFMAHNAMINESTLSDTEVYDFLRDARVAFAPTGHPAVTKRLHREGVIIVYDNGWRDDLSLDDLRDFLSDVDIYTPNDKEAMKIAGTQDLGEAIRLLSQYTRPVITTGKGGCVFCDETGIHTSPAIDDFKTVDTTGAGDNFISGVIYGLVKGYNFEKCMRMGNIIGGYSTTQMGCFGKPITEQIIRQYL
jgi:ribokinase